MQNVLQTRSEAYFQWMKRQWKIERINRQRMAYKMRLNAIITSDNRPGKEW